MRKLFFVFFIVFSFNAISQSQPFNNEWIDFSKTYYKFKVGTSGLMRINQTSLTTIGLQNTPVEQFQLWRNGKQVPLYSTIATGIMGGTDYLEFWAKKNDGKPDKYLYKDTSYQLSDRLSLQSDTAAFFLTVNPSPSAANPNLRFADAANVIPATPPTPGPYFTYTQNFDFQQNINPGNAQNAGEYVYSASYDKGEFWSSQSIQFSSPLSVPLSNLYAAATGGTATLQTGVVGTIIGTRTIQLSFNNDNTNVVSGTISDNGDINPGVFSNTTIPLSTLNGSPTSLNIKITPSDASQYSYDAVVCNYIKLTYPRLFNFGGQTSFFFNLSSSATSNYLVISNFNSGGAVPVLYDFNNQVRYQANTSISGKLQFLLPASTTATEYLLVSEDASLNGISTVTSFQQKNFIDFSISANQGDYLIISNKVLGLSSGGAVENYRAYRSNTGIYTPKVYDIDELVDQFAFGIKKHPLSIKNFIRYANSAFSKKPAYVFIIGKGVTYDQYRLNQSSPYADALNLVPTWGWPPSDQMLISPDMNPSSTIGIGRLSAVTESEVITYLNKVKEYEAQQNNSQTIEAKGWMKQVIHVAGADDPSLNGTLIGYLNNYQNIITAPSFGANVTNFNKTTTGPVTAVANAQLNNLMTNGVSLVTYFGHGSSSVLDYANLNDPNTFNNTGRYPMFLVDGCSVGNFFDFDPSRFNNLTSIAEKYIFASERGAIGFIGNSHFGLTNYLDTYTTGFYNSLGNKGYNNTVSQNMLAGTAALKSGAGNSFSDYYTRTHAEETILAGDPVIKVYASTKPDFVVEQSGVVISPSIISVSDKQFTVKAYLYNIGKFTTDSFVNVTIQRVYPNGTSTILYNQKRANFAYEDSVALTIPILPSRDKGTNQIIVTINNDKSIDELTFANNSVTSSFAIFDNGITPVYPYQYAIVNKQNIQFIASTANPISSSATYTMDIDTTALFNSPLKVTKTVTSVGGAISFNPSLTFTDSTVYYWRVAEVPASGGAYVYSNSSFVYLKNSQTGFNQSHLYQHLQSTTSRMYLDSASRQWKYLSDSSNIVIRQAVYSATYNEDQDFQTVVNGIAGPASACVGVSLIFNVYDPITLLPLYNQPVPSTVQSGNLGGFMGSAFYCGSSNRAWNFEFPMLDTSGRRPARDFLNWIPQGYIVTARLNYDETIPLVNIWKSDSTYYGVNNTLYSTLKNLGFSAIDSFNKPRIFVMILKKNTPSFHPQWLFSSGLTDGIQLSINVATPDSLGYITSPQFGPAASWSTLKWRGASIDSKGGDFANVNVIGVDSLGNQTQLMTVAMTDQDVDISSISATTYPYIILNMRNADSINLTPYQLRYWRLLTSSVPEGALAPNVRYTFTDTANKYTNTDTFNVGQTINAAIAFKNISDTTFKDSILVNMQIVDANNNTTILPFGKLKKLAPGDTALIYTSFDASKYVGANTFSINVNPNNNQPEEYHFNNFIYKSFYVNGDKIPQLDVTFDGVHILNNDIVSSKPAIKIKLSNQAKYLLLNDTSLVTVQLLSPDGSLRQIKYDGDTLRFTPASSSGSENAAIVDYTPHLNQDGSYELIITGKSRSGISAGSQQYIVKFQVINTPAISNVFNYPNPFTTSTAFVFTLTGSEVPQNIKIEILTVTGKIVKEITREQLGNLHIGNNITTYKWDGTDMFGAKLGNGVYLYRVVTKLNGNSIGEFSTGNSQFGGTNTDQYFKGGYGKMYLMR